MDGVGVARRSIERRLTSFASLMVAPSSTGVHGREPFGSEEDLLVPLMVDKYSDGVALQA